MTTQATIKKCDVCGKTVQYANVFSGVHPFNGWFAVHKNGGCADFPSINDQRGWPKDACSAECLGKLAETFAETTPSKPVG